MKNSTTALFLAITLAFAAFVGGFCLGRNTAGISVELSAYATTGTPATAGAFPSSTGVSSTSRININTASLEELDSLPGIGPTIAQRIIDYRTQFGNFKSVYDLLEVEDIGEKTLEKIFDRITV